MKKGYIYFLVGALLCGFIIVAFQISRAAVAYPNPGHPLTCTTVSCVIPANGGCSAGCPDGYTLTGGGFHVLSAPVGYLNISRPDPGSWHCFSYTTGGTCYARCCKVGE